MTIDATFWVAVSFFIFIGLLFYFKVHQKIKLVLDNAINDIKNQINEAEKLKEEAKLSLSEQETRLSNSKNEIKLMIDKANKEAEKFVIKTNADFHTMMENRKKNADQKIKQMKEQAFKDIKNMSARIAIESVERLLKNSLDKNKLNKLYSDSLEETKLALKKKSG
jgi:F-type H+-transporting ATPase subunit b